MAQQTLHRTSLIPFALLAAAACGSVQSSPPAGDDDSIDPVDAPAGTECLPGSYDIDKALSEGGPLEIAGTVTFAATVPAGKTVFVSIKQVGSGGSDFEQLTLSEDRTEITYRFSSVTDGEWIVCSGADLDDNGSIDAGIDFIGCYDGTSDAPLTSEETATPIALGGACHPGTDFATVLAP